MEFPSLDSVFALAQQGLSVYWTKIAAVYRAAAGMGVLMNDEKLAGAAVECSRLLRELTEADQRLVEIVREKMSQTP